MLNSLRSFRAIFCVATLLALTAVIGCSSGGSTPAAQPISVTISPATGSAATMVSGATQNFAAVVANDGTATPGVTWAISSGGGSLTNVTPTSVTYTAASPVTGTSAVLIATSNTDVSKSVSVSITLTPIAVSAISPATATLGNSDTQGFSGATVTGDSTSAGVTWSISPSTGAGTINAATGVYSAPTGVISATTTVTVTAKSVKDPTKSQTATITLQPISLSAVSPAVASLLGGSTQTFSSNITYDGSASGLTWTVSPSTGAGTITAGGVYTAPAVVGSTVSATITAKSVKDPTKSATVATVTLVPISVSFGSTTSYAIDSQQQLNIPVPTVNNDSSNSGVTYSATAGTTGLGPNGFFAFNAPTVASGPATTATITATSVKDTSKTATVTVTVNPAIAVSPAGGTTLTAGTTGTAYSQLITLSNGTGTKTLALKSGQTLPPGLSITGTTISGTPTTAGTYSFVVAASDQSAVAPVLNLPYTIVVTAAPLAWTTSGTLPAATVGIAYSQNLVTTGGTGAVTCQAGPVTGTLPGGLQINSNCTITGTPAATGSFTFTAKAIDSTSATLDSGNLTIVSSNPVGATISGSVGLTSSCGSVSTLPGITMTLNTTPTAMTVTTSANGAYTFANVPAGTYTITPSITGPSAAFSPATIPGLVVTATTVTNNNNFAMQLGYTVSGTVSYTGTQTGRTYVTLSCGSSGNNNGSLLGTSVATKGAYTIRGVPPGDGSVSVQATMDVPGSHAAYAYDPAGAASTIVNTANKTGINVSMADTVSLPAPLAPGIQLINPMATGALIEFSPSVDGNNVETATSYTLQWSTTATPFTVAGSKVIPAVGASDINIWVVNGLTTGTTYYFRATATNATGTSAASATSSGITMAAPSGGNAVSGSVTFPGTALGPLYVGFINTSNGAFYGTIASNPASAQAYTVSVPTGNGYYFIAILDNNGNGAIDAGDLNDIAGNPPTVNVAGAMTGQNVTLSGGNTINTLITGHNRFTNGATITDSYSVQLGVNSGLKLPVAVTLTSGAGVLSPVDIGFCLSCGGGPGGQAFQQYFNMNGVAPTVGGTYALQVTYSDTSTETVSPTVSAVLGTSAMATALAPITGAGTSLTPVFSWVYPTAASSYTYGFQFGPANGGSNWQVPGSGANSKGFTSTQIPASASMITYGTDPLGNTSNTAPALSHGTNYSWQVETMDSAGNSASQIVYYQP